MSMPATSFDLAAQVDSLKREETWQRSDRVARTLVQRPRFHLVLTVIKLGAALREHRAEGHVTVQTVVGHLRMHVGAQSVDLPAGHLLALHVTPANEQERKQVAILAKAVQDVTGETVEVAFVDQGFTGAAAAADAAAHGIRQEVVKLEEAKRGFVLLPRRWVIERSFAWAARFRRLARDDERLPATVAGLHFVAFACLMLHRLLTIAVQSP